MIDTFREAPYKRKEFRALGKVYEPKGISLPSITKDPKFTFGDAIIYGDSIADCIKPNQPDYDLDENVVRLYRTSHRKHRVGEPIHHGLYIYIFSLFAYNYSHLEEISKLKAKELLQQERKNRQNASGGAIKDIMIHKVTENT